VTDAADISAMCSAIAASASAIAAFLALKAQGRALGEQVRPDIVLSGWSRQPNQQGNTETIGFAELRNVGAGSARPLVLNASARADDGRPLYVMTTIHLPSMDPLSRWSVDAQITVFWNNVALGDQRRKYLPITIEAYYWDSLQRRHRTKYNLFVAREVTDSIGSAVLPGVGLSSITTTINTVRWLKLSRALARLPLIGRRFRDPAT
jgi:hypothetical protein